MNNKQLTLFDNEYYEAPEEDVQDLENLSFKVHTSLIYKLGEELIADEVTALAELVKNSYDADSDYVEVIVDPEYTGDFEGTPTKGKITIADAGCGMDKKDIINGWLTISNSHKKKMKKNKEVTKKHERMPLGDKGLGRLSVQKLGKVMRMITKKQGSSIEYNVIIPWGDFRKNTTLEQIKIKCTERIVEKGKEDGYTTLVVEDLINSELWNKKDNVDELEKELSHIISPFRKSNSFYIYARIGQRELDFSSISEEILDAAISKYSFQVDEGKVKIKGSFKTEFFNSSKIEFEVSKDHVQEFFNAYNEKLVGCNFNEETEYPITFYEEFDINQLSGMYVNEVTKQVLSPGNFDGKIYSYSLDRSYINKQFSKLNFKMIQEVPDFRGYVHRNSGIKVFRDDFIILPYGYGAGGDWLSLSASKGTSGKYYNLKNETVIGYVQLYGKHSYNLREKTDREGLIEDGYFLNFKSINENIIKRINTKILRLKDNFNKYVKSVVTGSVHHDTLKHTYEVAVDNIKGLSNKSKNIANSIEITSERMKQSERVIGDVSNKIKQVSITAKEEAVFEKLLKQLSDNILYTRETLQQATKYLQTLDNINNQMSVIEDDYQIIVQQMQEIAELAGIGIIAETLTHELYTLVDHNKKRTDKIATYFKENYETDREIIRYFSYVKNSAEAIRKQVSHLSPSFRNVRARKETIDILEILNNHKEYYYSRSDNKKIDILILNQSNNFKIRANIGMINQTLDNLYLNSEHWLQHAMELGEIDKGQYTVDIRENGKLYIWDNGFGIDESIASNIFEPFVSNKKNGRGLGLYIVSQILAYHQSSIRLMREKNCFGNLYKFEIDLNKCMVFEG